LRVPTHHDVDVVALRDPISPEIELAPILLLIVRALGDLSRVLRGSDPRGRRATVRNAEAKLATRPGPDLRELVAEVHGSSFEAAISLRNLMMRRTAQERSLPFP
jgi:hypothetical protein